MTAKEITALRKSGRLQEALEAAENEFAQNLSPYTAGALFWCLNDIIKQQSGEDAAFTFERMQWLYSTFCEGDEFMQKAIAFLLRRTVPHFQQLEDAIADAKKGINICNKYNEYAEMFKAGSLDKSLYNDFGWLVYYALKQTPVKEAHIRKKMLANYLNLGLSGGSVLHSLILVEAIKVEHNTPLQFRIRDFIRMWGLQNLREQDWEQYRTDSGNILPSTVEKLIGVYAKELKTDGVEAPDEFIRLVDEALPKYPQSQNMPYYKAIVLMSQGKKSEALEYYRNLILRFPSKSYQWSHTAELVEDTDTKIGLLCKALSCGDNGEYVVRVRLKLAAILIQKNLLSNAKYELEQYKQTYLDNGWNLKEEFRQLYSRLASTQPADSNSPIYTEYARKADEFIYSELPTVTAIKVLESQSDDRNHPGRKITTWMLRTKDCMVRLRKPAKFGLNKRTPDGAIFDVKLKDEKIVWIKNHNGAISEPWLTEHSGTVHLRTDKNGRKYAIVSGTYVGEKLLSGIADGQQISVLSIQQKDGRWSAVSLLKK